MVVVVIIAVEVMKVVMTVTAEMLVMMAIVGSHVRGGGNSGDMEMAGLDGVTVMVMMTAMQ